MLQSIVAHVATACGLETEDESFDEELLSYINGALGAISQQGCGKPEMQVADRKAEWPSILTPEELATPIAGMVPEYLVVQTRILFDPPPQGTQRFMEEHLNELLWRIGIQEGLLEKSKEEEEIQNGQV